MVVPLAGTWIETLSLIILYALIGVVPLAGTWIETFGALASVVLMTVVPLAGTWIETREEKAAKLSNIMSFPSRERGLKPSQHDYIRQAPSSFPSRERGLKQLDFEEGEEVSKVVPLAGTWIETRGNRHDAARQKRRSPRGNVD